MSLEVEDFEGKYEVHNISDLEPVLQKRYGHGLNGFWISRDTERYPVISLLVNNSLATLLYVPNEGHPGFASVGQSNGLEKEGFTTFCVDTVEQEQEVVNNQVVPVSAGLLAIYNFFDSKELPKSIEWIEL